MAGNTGTKTLKVEFDNVGPTGKHELDGKNKDLYFRIGEGDTGTGFKYSSGSWGNSTTMKIRGLFEDEGSGVKMIYYQVCHPGDTSTAMTAANYETTSNGYFAPFAKKGEEREEAVVKNNDEQGTSTTTVNIKTNYEAILTGFVEGSNTLRLVAVDNVGNAKLDQEYSLNVDLTPPTIESSNSEIPTNGTSNIVFSGTASDEGSGFESATKSLEFYIGKTKYKVTSDGADNTPKGSYTFTQVSGNDWEWTLTIDNSNGWLMRQDIQDELTNHPGIYANIKDKAGLSTSAIKVASLTIDTTPPEVVIGDIKDAYTSTNDTEVNGNITISGRASDNKEFPTPAVTPKLYYRTTNPGNATITSTTGWTEIAEANYDEKEGLNTWSYTLVDTTKAFGTNYSGNVWLMASAVDKAGNTGYSAAKKIIVDQNTDRPIISFTDLSNDTTWLQRSDLRGSISDDDGIEEFRVFVGNTCPNDWQLNSSNVTSGYPPVATSSGSWSFDAGEDGTKRLWFYVKDTEGTVFISSRGNAINKPYYQYSTDTGVSQGVYGHSATTFVEVKKDTTQPKLWTTLVAIGENSDPYNATTNPGGLKDIDLLKQDRGANQLNSSKIVGGKQNHFVIYVPVYEEFVDAVTAQILDEENRVETNSYTINCGPKPTVVLEKVTVDGTPGGTPVTIERDDDSLIYTYYRGEVIDVSSLPKAKSGVKSVQITIKDQAGNEKVQTCTLTVDNKGPTVNLISPKSTDEVTGIVDVSGTSIDGNASVDETYWMIPTSTQRGWDDDVLASSVNDALWSNIRADDTTATSWKFRFDGEAGSNPLLTRFDKANTDGNTYYTDYTNYVYTLRLYIKIVDSVGNYTIVKFTIKHNPDADRPRTTITYPTSANYGAGLDYAVLGGTILVTGNVQFPSGTTYQDGLYLQIATDTDSFDSYSTVNTNGSDPYVAKNKYMLPVMNADQALAARRAAGSTYSVLEGFDSEEDKAAWWGIEAEGSGSSWYINLNSDEKMNPAGETTTNIWIRACGINANGKIGVWSDPVAIHIDANAPIQNASIRQYEDVSPSANNLKAATPTANNAYVADMFIKGQWYLTVEMTDESSLEKVDVKDKNGELMSSSSYYLTAAYDEGGKKKRILWIPMDTSGNTASYTVAVTDTEGSGKHITTNKYSFNIDNEAPACIEGSLTGNGDLLANGSVIAEKDYVYTIS
ncbi:MAG: Ig-like domain repeat protein, partial [Treponema sp.]|nr:Ig-like domain repeat protein [Treponema sp.]